MIPKTIHYCWFSNEEKPKIVKECIEEWKHKLTDFDIIEWNTKNFDINNVKYTREAFLNRKWAFVSDYFRLWVLNKYGGIYLDVDVIVNKNLEKLLTYDLLIAWENLDLIGAHFIAAKKNHIIIKRLLEFYDNYNFISENGKMNLTPMPQILTKIFLTEYKIKRNGRVQKLPDNGIIFPMDYFTSNVGNGNNYCEHLFLGSWNDSNRNYFEEMQNHYKLYYSSFFGRIIYFLKKAKIKYLK